MLQARSVPDSPHHVLAFDSGIGGLGIVRALRAHAPAARVDYLADTAVFPYGEQEDQFLVNRIVTLIGEAITRHRPQVVVIACNTASTLALSALRAAYPATPFVGCVPP
ncbi:MAG: glutamate racemase, partial [Acetobacter papayae]